MEIHLAPEIENQLQQMATSQHKDLPQIVEETVTRAWRLLQEEELWLSTQKTEIQEQIQTGLAELKRGEGISSHELDDYLARLEALPE